MTAMDLDVNGKVTLEEMGLFMKTHFYTNEEDVQDLQNENGQPATKEDIVRMIESDAKELMAELDTDSSGHLDLKEVTTQYLETDPDLPDENDSHA